MRPQALLFSAIGPEARRLRRSFGPPKSAGLDLRMRRGLANDVLTWLFSKEATVLGRALRGESKRVYRHGVSPAAVPPRS